MFSQADREPSIERTSRERGATARDAADGAVEGWLERLDAQSNDSGSRNAAHVRYVLAHREVYYVPRIEIEAYAATTLRDGTIAQLRSIDILNMSKLSGSFVLPVDRTIGRLAGVSGITRPALAAPAPVILGTLLEMTIETGRLHWKGASAPALRRRELGSSRLTWHTGSDGRQRPGLLGRPHATLLPSKPVWYVDAATNEAGPVDLGIAPELAAIAVSSPALTQRQAQRAQVVWRRVITPGGGDPPALESALSFVDDEPVPVLRLDIDGDGIAAELRFAYGRYEVGERDTNDAFEMGGDGAGRIWPRRRDAELRARKRLMEAGSLALDDDRWTFSTPSGWARFVHVEIPKLRDDGWHVDIDDGFAIDIVEPEGDWDAQFVENENHWFDLDLGITISGERVALLPILVEALRERGLHEARSFDGEPLFARLPSGAFAVLPGERIARLLATLIELFDRETLTPQGRLEIAPSHLGVLDDLAAQFDLRWNDAGRLAALVRDLTAAPSGDALAIPDTFSGTLRSYQRDGVAWLQTLRRHGYGAVLADDMGLGKTVQLLAHAAIEKAQGRLAFPILIVAPTSVVPNWRAEIARFTPNLTTLSLTGSDRSADFERIGDYDIVLTTYALLQRDAQQLLERDWSLAVLDEAQAVKNPRSKGAAYVARLRASQRIALTGTPIENHLDELWSIFAFAVPQLLADRTSFTRRFRTPIEKRNDLIARKALGQRVHPFLMRRTKEAVEADLPPKSEIVSRVELDGAQRDLYETIRLAMHKRVRDEVGRRGVERSHIIVLDALLKLRQVCCDPRLVKLPAARTAKDSAKLEALMDMLPDLIDDGRRILLFSQFTSMLDLIKPELTQRGIDFVELRGATKDRSTPVRRFQDGEVPLFLISLKAGGTGLNLTTADTVIHYDPWWNPAVERQATDRAHRIGQEHPVFVYKLVTVGTVEERILDMQERKAGLAEGLFGDAASAPLDAADIDTLFAPLAGQGRAGYD